MSTYLVAFVVGPLEATDVVDVDGIPLRVVHTAGKERLTSFASKPARTRSVFYAKYFDQPYPATSSTSSRSPTSPSGDGELGCVTFREAACSPTPRPRLVTSSNAWPE